MERKVVAVMDTLQQKEDVFQELKERGYEEEDIKIIGRDNEDAKLYERFFEQGHYVVTVDIDYVYDDENSKYDNTLREPKTPKDHHHFPHHQMRRGM
ncbi:hypothetical protein LGQ02_03030 [Bacillus shivajii]|uniref:hypothetical protein n=1 Tax=Bacillus shivajii TaxID=1983719 RepID=UPI001CFB74CF|nr:hypothetical protein [Bacillus shivajii]UCZ53776.1 hypothetical protein LGQ02_03030 [Bacillus shivajii]